MDTDLEYANPSSDIKDYRIVLALDIGTTYCGYAFSTKSKPNDIRKNKEWGSEYGRLTTKTPTAVLTTKAGKFVEFGYRAKRMYADDNKDLFLYESYFKMKLYKSETSLDDIIVKSRNNHGRIQLKSLIEMTVKFLYSHAVDELNKNYHGLNEALIRIVLTIPAIWGDAAKDFMRRAARNIHIDLDRVMLALEPEAASLYCRSLKPTELNCNNPMDVKLPTGTKYVVIDCGGGTMDITAHEVGDSGNIKEIHCANGGPWGGGQMFQRFETLLEKLLGENFIANYKEQKPEGWFEIDMDFEFMKRSYRKTRKMNVKLPISLIRAYNKQGWLRKISRSINKHKKEGFTFTDDGKLILDEKISEGLFKPTIDNILEHINKLWDNNKIRDAKYVFMVGGFSECELLYNSVEDAIKTKQKDVHVLRPSLADTAVLYGGVMFGQSPSAIAVRMSRLTYGVGVMKAFNPLIHDKDKKYYIDGVAKCRDLFKIIVRKNEEIPLGTSKDLTMFPSSPTAQFFELDIFTSDKDRVMYTTDPGVKKIGSLKIAIPDNHLPHSQRSVKIYFFFGGTEMYVRIQDTTKPEGASETVDIKYL